MVLGRGIEQCKESDDEAQSDGEDGKFICDKDEASGDEPVINTMEDISEGTANIFISSKRSIQ